MAPCESDIGHLDELRRRMHLTLQTPTPATGKGTGDVAPFVRAQIEYKTEMERLHKLGYEYSGLPRRGLT